MLATAVPSVAPSQLPQNFYNVVTEYGPHDTMLLTYDGGEAAIEQDRGDDLSLKKKKVIERKNQFYPNKATALNIWAKSESAAGDIKAIIEEVDGLIKADANVTSDRRMSLINERRVKRFNNLPTAEKQKWEIAARDSDQKPPQFGSLE
jgi:phage gp45-like